MMMKGTSNLTGLLFAVILLFSSFALAQPNNEAELTRLRGLQDRYEALMLKFWRDGSNPAVRRQFLDASVAYATAVMNSPALHPRIKYPKALRIYRRVLLHEPNNELARKYRDLIIDIYRSMNRPIPT